MNLILQDDFSNSFTICKSMRRTGFKRSKSKIIVLNNRKDIEAILAILKQNVSIYRPDFQEDNDIIAWLDKKTFVDIEDELEGLNIKDSYNEILELCDKIGVPTNIKEKIVSTDSSAEKDLVHKEKIENVMISKSRRIYDTNVFYLRGFFDTDEIVLDHKAGDHIESVILTEICRQACLSVCEETLSGREHLIPIQELKIYKRFVTSNSPLIIQAITAKTKKRGGYCVFALYQDGKCCVKGYMVGRIFQDKSNFKEMRSQLDK